MLEAAGYTGADLDGCITEVGSYTPLASEVVLFSETYGEVSPSGTGLHFLIEGTVGPTIVRKDIGVELYHEARYFTVTGRQVEETPAKIGPAPRLVDRLIRYDAENPKPDLAPIPSKPPNPKANGHAAHLHGDTDPERVREALRVIPADDRETWVQIGMAIKANSATPASTFGASGRRPAPEKFSEKDAIAKWRSFKRKGIGIGTLFHYAKAYGWTPSKSPGPMPLEASYREDVLREEPAAVGANGERASPKQPKKAKAPRRRDPFHATEDAIAEEFAARYAEELRYCHDWGQWLKWSGSHWKRERLKLAFHYARQLAREANVGGGSVTRQGFDCCGR